MKNTQSTSVSFFVFIRPVYPSVWLWMIVVAVMMLSGRSARADVLYRETFGNSDSVNRKAPNLYGWQMFEQDGTFFNTTSSGMGVDTLITLGSPTNVANINAGPNADGTTNALPGSRLFWNGANRLAWTPEFPIDPTLYQPSSIVFSFYLGDANAADQVRIVIRQGGKWYYSTTAYSSPATLTGDFAANAVYETLTYSPTAANWQILNFDGGYNGGGYTNGPAAAATNSTTVLSGGGTATSDLSGTITAFGILGLSTGGTFANTAGNIRFDTFEVDGTLVPVQPPKVITWQGSISADWDLVAFNWLTNGVATNYSTGDFVFFDNTGLTNIINLPNTVLPGSVTVNTTTGYTFGGSGGIVGNGALTKSGTGTLTLLGANTYSGGTFINGGAIQVGNGGGSGAVGTGTITNNGSLIFNRTNSVSTGAISGSGSLTQNGTGALTLGGPNLYTGSTIVNAGTLVANSGLPNGSLLTNAAGSTVIISGTNGGTTSINGSLLPANAGAAATFTTANGLTLGSTAVVSLDLGSTNVIGRGSNDLVQVLGNLAAGGTVKAVGSLGPPLLGVPYTLMTFGSRTGNFGSLVGQTHYTTTFNTGTTNLTVTFSGVGANLEWTSTSSSSWDVGISTNWNNFAGGVPDLFYHGDTVTFDDNTIGVQTAVTLTTALFPGAVTNIGANNYTINGPGRISGAAGIMKNGSGTLTLNSTNDFTGAVTVSAGILKTGTSSALGATNAGTTIADSATLDVSGGAANTLNLGRELVSVTGAGTDGNGAIINSGVNAQSNALQLVTLTGATTFGGNSRWDIRGSASAPGVLSAGNQSLALTKKGANQVSLANISVDAALAAVDIQAGTLEIAGNTTGLGNSSANLFVRNGATLQLFSATNKLNKQIQLEDGAAVASIVGSNTIVGPMTLAGVTMVNVTNGSLTFSNTLSGSGSIIKNNTGTLVLAGADGQSGGITVNDGTLLFNTTNLNTNPENLLTENSSASSVPVTVGGNGTFKGAVDIEDRTWPGVGGRPSTLNLGNGANYVVPSTGDDFLGALVYGGFGAGKGAVFSLTTATTTGGGVNDLINVTGNLVGNSAPVLINPLAPLSTGTYTLVTYSSGLVSAFGTPRVLPAFQPARYQFTLNQGGGVISLTVNSGAGALRWNNAAGNGIWDVTNSVNWFNTGGGTNDYFAQLDAATFDDTAGGANTNVTLVNNIANTGLLPSTVTVNVTNLNFGFNGSGKISGWMSLAKKGPGGLTVGTTNDFTGGTTISGGTLVVNAPNALGNAAFPVVITNGGTLDVGGPGFAANAGVIMAAQPIVVSGMGAGNNGAIVNGGSVAQQNAVQNITLAGDAAFGGPGLAQGANNLGRWDMRGGTPVLSTGGHPYNLYKVGLNQVSFVGVNVDTNLADINLLGGELGIETTTTGLGNPTNTLTIASGASLEFFQFLAPLNKKIVANGGAVLTNTFNIWFNNGPGYPTNVIVGVVTLTNGLVTAGGSGNGSFSNVVTGPGSLAIAGNVSMDATNTYTGDTIVSNNTLFLRGNASINSSPTLSVLAGATLNVARKPNALLTVIAGQTLAGNGTVAGSLSNAAGSFLSPGQGGAIGRLTVTNAATLNGTAVMKISPTAGTNDVLAVSGNLAIGGTLMFTNISGAPTNNQVFKLFNAATYTTNYTAIVPSIPGPGFAWDVSGLSSNGTLKVVSTGLPGPGPNMLQISISGANVIISGTNGVTGNPWTLLQSTNLALPFNQWDVRATGTFNGGGAFTTNLLNAMTNHGMFYELSF